jgi:F-type H+-transporting ATPase subunit epsilon
MYHLSLMTPEKVIFEGQVYSLIAPGKVGYLEVLTNHAPIMTSLKPGKLVITDENKKKWMGAVSGGFLEVSHNNATLLVDAFEFPADIDLKRAESASKRARERIASAEGVIDRPRAKSALERAQNRIKIFHKNMTSG